MSNSSVPVISHPSISIVNETTNDVPINTSSFNHTSKINASYYENFTKVFDTLYMKNMVKKIAERNASDCCITEYLPQEDVCSCCLCRLRHKSDGTAYEFCIKKHPTEDTQCGNGMIKRSFKTRFAYQEQTICDNCMSSLTLKSIREHKSKEIRCIFDACSHKLKNKTSLRSHYLKHLNVKKFMCSICERGFSKSGIKMHERKHALRKSFLTK